MACCRGLRWELERVHVSLRSGECSVVDGDRCAERLGRGLPGCDGLPARRRRLPESGVAFAMSSVESEVELSVLRRYCVE